MVVREPIGRTHHVYAIHPDSDVHAAFHTDHYADTYLDLRPFVYINLDSDADKHRAPHQHPNLHAERHTHADADKQAYLHAD